MNIRAVLDTKAGKAVHAVAGHREQYQPIIRNGVTFSPYEFASQLVATVGIRDFYLADLDAINGQVADWESLTKIAALVDSLWFDVGIKTEEHVLIAAAQLESLKTVAVAVLGLETLSRYSVLAKAIDTVPLSQLCFSLDLRRGVPITSIPTWQGASPLEIARQVIVMGFRRLIILDLAAVGTQSGCPTLQLCRQIRDMSAPYLSPSEQLEIATGGGIRDRQDLRQLEENKVDHALVATALERVTLNRCHATHDAQERTAGDHSD